jgi:hypothetical protein
MRDLIRWINRRLRNGKLRGSHMSQFANYHRTGAPQR